MSNRNLILMIICLMVFMIATPAIMVFLCEKAEQTKQPQVKLSDEVPRSNVFVRVYLVKEKRVVRLPLETYIAGVVAAEMPANFHLEALKAQSLAARTYIAKRLTSDRSDMKRWGKVAAGADVTDTVMHQAFLTDAARQKKWGQDYAWKTKRIQRVVKATAGQIITYQNKPIYAAFFSTSNGWTENSEDYFRTEYPYLRSVSSDWDRQSPKYSHSKRLSLTTFESELEEATGKQIDIEQATNDTFMRVSDKTAGNRIAKITIGDQLFTGRQIREALGLSSSDFTWSVQDDHIAFHTKGYGHGVGMSQWGANLMASQGKTFEQIIQHYYQGVTIQQGKWPRGK